MNPGKKPAPAADAVERRDRGKLLTPDDVATLARTTRRGASILMRRAGGWKLNDDWRISEEGWLRWLNKFETRMSYAANCGDIAAHAQVLAGTQRDAAEAKRKRRDPSGDSGNKTDRISVPVTQPRKKRGQSEAHAQPSRKKGG